MTATAQRDLNLQRANEIRLARAALKHRIARGEITVASVILKCPEAARTWPVADLLRAQRYAAWGRARALKVLPRARISELRTVGQLTQRQRVLLAEMLGQRPDGDEGGEGSGQDG
jgi:hypothetical protein